MLAGGLPLMDLINLMRNATNNLEKVKVLGEKRNKTQEAFEERHWIRKMN